MDTIGENTIYESPDGTIEIAGPHGWIEIRPEDRKRLGALIGTKRHHMKCVFCERPIAHGFECAECHLKAENQSDPVYVFTIWRNNEVVKSDKWPRSKIFQSYNAICKKNKADQWDWEDRVYRDDKGNAFALRILGNPEPIEPVQYVVPRIFQDAG